ncbi:hypothetical protein CIK05_03875 [Bdellovibrio sp. qaytius]|nr:hypothetical protein CIK05_03875 [Bdellovibrio sp. qaytius]
MNIEQFLLKAKELGFSATVEPWIEAKKVKGADLAFLSPLKTDLQWQLLFKALMQLIEARTSYTDSLKNLELISDLILMGHEETLFEQSHDFAKWSVHLRALRYPATTKRDDQLKDKLEKLPWPYGSKTKFERRGDRAGIELKMFITSEADLIKAISSLERVKDQIGAE